MSERSYLVIDLKSFYASVECVERGLDPMTTDLVVADPTRTEKTICLAVSPSMKAKGVRNRCRVFEIPKNIDYIMAPPRMQKYIDYAAEIYELYLRFFSPEDIHVYSIDEAFIDVTNYLKLYSSTPRQLAVSLMDAISGEIGVRSTCGIGTNLYLAKIALDITAKHSPDFIGELDEQSYRESLWDHRPITDFWRIGPGTARRLAKYGIHTMGAVAHADEDLLYREFGIDAELLIDHAWGREPVTMEDIHSFKPKSNSFSSGQVLAFGYGFDEGRVIVKEMMDNLCLEMTEEGAVSDSVTLTLGYEKSDWPPASGGTAHVDAPTSSEGVWLAEIAKLYDDIFVPGCKIKRVGISCNVLRREGEEQLSLFTDPEQSGRDRRLQQAVLSVKKRYGKNSLLRGMNFEESATGRERNMQIGGHKSGEEQS